jgi:hypothetical protein
MYVYIHYIVTCCIVYFLHSFDPFLSEYLEYLDDDDVISNPLHHVFIITLLTIAYSKSVNHTWLVQQTKIKLGNKFQSLDEEHHKIHAPPNSTNELDVGYIYFYLANIYLSESELAWAFVLYQYLLKSGSKKFTFDALYSLAFISHNTNRLTDAEIYGHQAYELKVLNSHYTKLIIVVDSLCSQEMRN